MSDDAEMPLEDLIALAESKLSNGDIIESEELFRQVEKRTASTRAMQAAQLSSLPSPPSNTQEPSSTASVKIATGGAAAGGQKRGGVSRLFGSALLQAAAERGVSGVKLGSTRTHSGTKRTSAGTERAQAQAQAQAQALAAAADRKASVRDEKEESNEDHGDNGEGEDWESGWEAGLGQLKRPSSAAKGQVKGGIEAEDDESASPLLPPPLDHVVEIFTGLGSSVTTSHVEAFISVIWPYCSGDGLKTEPLIRWVDENHCLLVCPDAGSAEALVSIEQKQFGVRPHSQSSARSRAYSQVELVAPKGERPKTTAAVARRFLSHALGVDLRDRQAEKELGNQRKAAKEEKMAKEKARAEAWEE